MESHLKIVAVIQIVFGILGLAFAGGFLVMMLGIGVLSEDPEAMTVLTIIGTALAIFFGFTALPGLAGGIGLLKGRQWGRIVVIIVSILNLINFPIGTGIGAYSLWVLFQDETEKLLS